MESSGGENSAIYSCWREETSSPFAIGGAVCFFDSLVLGANLGAEYVAGHMLSNSATSLDNCFDKGILKSLLGVIQAMSLMVWG